MITDANLHISEQVSATLIADGWRTGSMQSSFEKLLPNRAAAGTVSDGSRTVRLNISDDGRWLARVDQGLGTIEREIDLRDYAGNPAGAIAAVLS